MGPSAITSGKVLLSRGQREGWRRGWYPLAPLESRLCSVAPAGGLSSIILPGMRWDGSWCSECSFLVDSWIRDMQNRRDLCATWRMGLGPWDGDGHSPAFALGVRRKATRSRSGCIFRERLPRMEMLVLPPGSLADPPASWRETQCQWTQRSGVPLRVLRCFILKAFSESLPRPHSICLMTFSGWLCENHPVTTPVPTDDDSEQSTCSSPEQEPKRTRWGL